MFGAISRGSRLGRVLTASLLVAGQLVNAAGYNLDLSSERMFWRKIRPLGLADYVPTESVKDTAKGVADDMLSFYSGNKPGGTPGLLPAPYYCSLHSTTYLWTGY